MEIFKFNVKMSCSGCSGAVNRALSKLEGVDKIDINLEAQLVTVTASSATKDQIFETIRKTGKEVTPL